MALPDKFAPGSPGIPPKWTSSAKSGVETGGGVALEGKHANRGIVCPGTKAKKGVLPFRGVPSRIASVRRRGHPLKGWRKNKAAERKHHCDK